MRTRGERWTSQTQALDSADVERIKKALREYADAVQQVKMQVMARELLATLLRGELDEALTGKLRSLIELIDVASSVLVEVERYCAEVRAVPSSALTLARAHLDRIEHLSSCGSRGWLFFWPHAPRKKKGRCRRAHRAAWSARLRWATSIASTATKRVSGAALWSTKTAEANASAAADRRSDGWRATSTLSTCRPRGTMPSTVEIRT